jgi:hypothetical protein
MVPLKKKMYQHVAALIGQHKRAEDLAWGTFGPAALTYFLLKRGLVGQALPVETFYPINWTEISLFFATPDAVSSRLSEKTIGVHLRSTSILLKSPDSQTWRNALPPANSWLGAMCERYSVGSEIRLDARHRIGALAYVQEPGRQSADALTKRGASRPTSQSSGADAQA